MDKQSYINKFERFVEDNLHSFYEGIAPWQMSESGHNNSLVYFRNHLPRFAEMIDLYERHAETPKISCEIGSFYPYTTLYFGGEIDLYDIIPTICPTAKPYSVEGVTLYDFNLCVDQFPDKKYDLVILSEVLEHLPTNLFEIENKVIGLLKSGSYLIVTYPAQYCNNAENYDQEIGDPTVMHGGHLREFTEETVKLFFRSLVTVEQHIFSYPAYGKTIARLYWKS